MRCLAKDVLLLFRSEGIKRYTNEQRLFYSLLARWRGGLSCVVTAPAEWRARSLYVCCYGLAAFDFGEEFLGAGFFDAVHEALGFVLVTDGFREGEG